LGIGLPRGIVLNRGTNFTSNIRNAANTINRGLPDTQQPQVTPPQTPNMNEREKNRRGYYVECPDPFTIIEFNTKTGNDTSWVWKRGSLDGTFYPLDRLK